MHEKPHLFFSNVLKRSPFQKYCTGILSFLYYMERWFLKMTIRFLETENDT